jgi:tripeptidyl-peptidase I
MRGIFYLAICSLALAVPSRRSDHVVHERRDTTPVGWVKSRRADADKIIPLRIGMKQQNMHMLEDLLMDVADPDSSSYGQHWTPEKVVEFFAPSQSTLSAIRKWLTAAGFAEHQLRQSPNKGWIEFETTIAKAEWLFDAEYHVYEHETGAEQIGAPFQVRARWCLHN